MIPISELAGTDAELLERLKRKIEFGIHVAMPCVIQSFDPVKQTVEAQPTIRERVTAENGQISYMQYPLLINVPVVFPRSSGYIIQFPINKGDECLVIFSDLAIDNWWLKGNVQNPVEQRRHDLSDGFAILGLVNQAKLGKASTAVTGVSIQSPNKVAMLEVQKEDVILKCKSDMMMLSVLLNKIKEMETQIAANKAQLANHEARIAALEARP